MLLFKVPTMYYGSEDTDLKSDSDFMLFTLDLSVSENPLVAAVLNNGMFYWSFHSPGTPP